MYSIAEISVIGVEYYMRTVFASKNGQVTVLR
jgi:hypothetical protein